MNISDRTREMLGELVGKYGVTIMTATWMRLMEAEESLLLEPSNAKSGTIWDAALNIKTSDGKINTVLYFYNSFLEIFTVDREDDPLIIDTRILEDDEYLASKIKDVVDIRILLISGMINNDSNNMRESIEKVYNDNSEMFERIRIMEIDPKEKQ